jgi:hypothetical protein
MMPKKYAPMLFGLVLSGLMSLLVSGISTFRLTGLWADLIGILTVAWLAAWAIAFPVVLLIAPLARQFVEGLTADN